MLFVLILSIQMKTLHTYRNNEITLGLNAGLLSSGQKESLMSEICVWCNYSSLPKGLEQRDTHRDTTYAHIISCLLKTTQQHGQQNQSQACGTLREKTLGSAAWKWGMCARASESLNDPRLQGVVAHKHHASDRNFPVPGWRSCVVRVLLPRVCSVCWR